MRQRAPVADAPEIRRRLRDLAGERRRFGYGRLGILLTGQGILMKHKEARPAVFDPTASADAVPRRINISGGSTTEAVANHVPMLMRFESL
jgi:hypothetical protein